MYLVVLRIYIVSGVCLLLDWRILKILHISSRRKKLYLSNSTPMRGKAGANGYSLVIRKYLEHLSTHNKGRRSTTSGVHNIIRGGGLVVESTHRVYSDT